MSSTPWQEPGMNKIEGKPAIVAVKDLFSQHTDELKELVRAVVQEVLEAEIGAAKGERSDGRLGYRSG
jgi:putative transposase